MNLEPWLLGALALAFVWSVWQLGRRAGERNVDAAIRKLTDGETEVHRQGIEVGRTLERQEMARARSESQKRGWETRRASVAMRRATDVVVPALVDANAGMSAVEAGINEEVGNG